jgi:hypothetical protein
MELVNGITAFGAGTRSFFAARKIPAQSDNHINPFDALTLCQPVGVPNRSNLGGL